MRPVRLAMNVTGYSPWVPLDYIESWFGVTFAIVPSEDAVASATFTVQFVVGQDSPSQQGAAQVTRSGTTATVYDAGPNGIGHGLTTGDSVIIRGTGSPYLDSPVALGSASTPAGLLGKTGVYGQGDVGWQVASTPSPTTFTYTVANSGPAADVGVTTIVRLNPINHAVVASLTGRQNGTFNYPVRACRLYVSALSAGYVQMQILQGIAS